MVYAFVTFCFPGVKNSPLIERDSPILVSKALAKRTRKSTQAFNLRPSRVLFSPPTYVDLHRLALTLIGLKFVRKSTRVFHFFDWACQYSHCHRHRMNQLL